MTPVATGINTTLRNPKKLAVLADALAEVVPLSTVKRVMKTTLKPQYQQAARTLKPQLEAYGACAGEKMLEYLKVLRCLMTLHCCVVGGAWASK